MSDPYGNVKMELVDVEFDENEDDEMVEEPLAVDPDEINRPQEKPIAKVEIPSTTVKYYQKEASIEVITPPSTTEPKPTTSVNVLSPTTESFENEDIIEVLPSPKTAESHKKEESTEVLPPPSTAESNRTMLFSLCQQYAFTNRKAWTYIVHLAEIQKQLTVLNSAGHDTTLAQKHFKQIIAGLSSDVDLTVVRLFFGLLSSQISRFDKDWQPVLSANYEAVYDSLRPDGSNYSSEEHLKMNVEPEIEETNDEPKDTNEVEESGDESDNKKPRYEDQEGLCKDPEDDIDEKMGVLCDMYPASNRLAWEMINQFIYIKEQINIFKAAGHQMESIHSNLRMIIMTMIRADCINKIKYKIIREQIDFTFTEFKRLDKKWTAAVTALPESDEITNPQDMDEEASAVAMLRTEPEENPKKEQRDGSELNPKRKYKKRHSTAGPPITAANRPQRNRRPVRSFSPNPWGNEIEAGNVSDEPAEDEDEWVEPAPKKAKMEAPTRVEQKKRGRPAKSTEHGTDRNEMKEERQTSDPPKSKPAVPSNGEPKKRGRPSKASYEQNNGNESDEAAEAPRKSLPSQEQSAPVEQRKRGRPPKNSFFAVLNKTPTMTARKSIEDAKSARSQRKQKALSPISDEEEESEDEEEERSPPPQKKLTIKMEKPNDQRLTKTDQKSSNTQTQAKLIAPQPMSARMSLSPIPPMSDRDENDIDEEIDVDVESQETPRRLKPVDQKPAALSMQLPAPASIVAPTSGQVPSAPKEYERSGYLENSQEAHTLCAELIILETIRLEIIELMNDDGTISGKLDFLAEVMDLINKGVDCLARNSLDAYLIYKAGIEAAMKEYRHRMEPYYTYIQKKLGVDTGLIDLHSTQQKAQHSDNYIPQQPPSYAQSMAAYALPQPAQATPDTKTPNYLEQLAALSSLVNNNNNNNTNNSTNNNPAPAYSQNLLNYGMPNQQQTFSQPPSYPPANYNAPAVTSNANYSTFNNGSSIYANLSNVPLPQYSNIQQQYPASNGYNLVQNL